MRTATCSGRVAIAVNVELVTCVQGQHMQECYLDVP